MTRDIAVNANVRVCIVTGLARWAIGFASALIQRVLHEVLLAGEVLGPTAETVRRRGLHAILARMYAFQSRHKLRGGKRVDAVDLIARGISGQQEATALILIVVRVYNAFHEDRDFSFEGSLLTEDISDAYDRCTCVDNAVFSPRLISRYCAFDFVRHLHLLGPRDLNGAL